MHNMNIKREVCRLKIICAMHVFTNISQLGPAIVGFPTEVNVDFGHDVSMADTADNTKWSKSTITWLEA